MSRCLPMGSNHPISTLTAGPSNIYQHLFHQSSVELQDSLGRNLEGIEHWLHAMNPPVTKQEYDCKSQRWTSYHEIPHPGFPQMKKQSLLDQGKGIVSEREGAPS